MRRTYRKKSKKRRTMRRTSKRFYKSKIKSKTKSKTKTKPFRMIDGHMVIDVPLDKEVHKLSKASKKHFYEGYAYSDNIKRFFNIILKKLPKKLLYFPTFPLKKEWGERFDKKNMFLYMDDIIKRKESKSDLDSLDAIKQVLSGAGFSLEDEIDKGISQKYRYIAIILGIGSSRWSAGHQNIVIFDTKKKEVELFEPHGGYGKSEIGWYHDISYIMERFVHFMFEDYKYISPKEFLPKHELQGKVTGPYCITWCMMYLHYKLLNKDIPSKTIIKRMRQIDKTFLLRYMKFIENTIKNRKTKYKSKPIKTV